MSEETPEQQPAATHHPVRRRPRMVPFLLTGAVVGIIVGVIIAKLPGESATYSNASAVGYLGLFFGALGTLLGAIVFLGVDHLHDRRSKDHS